MENKIARVMSEVTAPVKVYQMTPAYYGAGLIAVTTGKKFLELIEESGEDTAVYEESIKGNEHKILLLPGVDLGSGIAIDKTMGHFIDETIEENFAKEGYVVMDLSI